MFTVKWTCADGSERFDSFDSFATAMFNALEGYPESAVRAEITGLAGRVWLYRLKGWHHA
jgi:hypothetical protein